MLASFAIPYMIYVLLCCCICTPHSSISFFCILSTGRLRIASQDSMKISKRLGFSSRKAWPNLKLV